MEESLLSIAAALQLQTYIDRLSGKQIGLKMFLIRHVIYFYLFVMYDPDGIYLNKKKKMTPNTP